MIYIPNVIRTLIDEFARDRPPQNLIDIIHELFTARLNNCPVIREGDLLDEVIDMIDTIGFCDYETEMFLSHLGHSTLAYAILQQLRRVHSMWRHRCPEEIRVQITDFFVHSIVHCLWEPHDMVYDPDIILDHLNLKAQEITEFTRVPIEGIWGELPPRLISQDEALAGVIRRVAEMIATCYHAVRFPDDGTLVPDNHFDYHMWVERLLLRF